MNSSLSTGARDEELCNILLFAYIFFNVTKLLISIEKKKYLSITNKMFKPERMSYELQRPENPA